MNKELEKKLLKIGKKLLDELKLHGEDVTIQMTKVVSGNYKIEINGYNISLISNDELTYLEEHKND